MIHFDLDKHDINHIHFIGIGGISMSAIAEVLLTFGYNVSGSDMKSSKITEKLLKKGAKIFIGHHEDNLHSCDLVVYTAAVKEDNPELQKANKLNIPVISRAEMLGLLMKKFKSSIAVSGTHGKTTTTSMISLILEYSDFNPTILVGGELDQIGGNVKVGSRDYFVTEACEYVGSFLKFFPHIGIILNIDADHLDYFKDLDHIIDTFTKFASLIPKNGFLIACKDDKNVQKILPKLNCHILTYGLNNSCNYWADNIQFNDRGHPNFNVFFNNKFLGKFELSIPGKHNIYNALASIACCHNLNVPVEKIIKNLKAFKGTHRRFDVLGKIDDITIIDDYAHHPTEIKATLDAASKLPHNRLWCIFQPHTYTRTKALLNDFASSFDLADKIIITDIYAAREKDTGQIHSKDLVKAIQAYHKDVSYMDTFEKITAYIRKYAQPNDLVLTMGAGDIYKVGKMLLEKDKIKG
ncbi:UDP-N-acetylmuramate--L-alanine ligase [Crassaminicella thermophila]|uniref:UDP-N-acetylmuramate--L-alanine ligase n=1 Tax=Crassaminicella thermophila TaxID=2599308 RepID=A0A5C0SAU2_CRATE|nr:UDP-N-acetylmuramate--L-alanine ligase [Crassaminicella thermophila]QEK11072.1 UDP-N-acetylmuramate--L-alanine ligase [Crassaminicella thermophila]